MGEEGAVCHVLHTSDTAEIAHSSILRSLKIRLVGRFSLWGDRDWLDKKVAAGRFLCTVHILEVFGFRPLSPSFALCDTRKSILAYCPVPWLVLKTYPDFSGTGTTSRVFHAVEV